MFIGKGILSLLVHPDLSTVLLVFYNVINGYVGSCMRIYGYVWLCRLMYAYVWLCMAM